MRERTERRRELWYDPTQPPIVKIITRKQGQKIELEFENRWISDLHIWLDAQTVISRHRRHYATFYSISYVVHGIAYSVNGARSLPELLSNWQYVLLRQWADAWAEKEVPYIFSEDYEQVKHETVKPTGWYAFD